MTYKEIQARISKLSRINLKIAHYLKVCDIEHRNEKGEPCEDPRCKAIARRYAEIEVEILELIDMKYEMSSGGVNVIDRLLGL